MNNVASELTNTIQNQNIEPIDNLGMVISLIIFGAVAVFFGFYIYNFIKGYKLANMDQEEIDNYEEDSKEEVKSMRGDNSKGIICDYCGEENDLNSNFCKNCGRPLK